MNKEIKFRAIVPVNSNEPKRIEYFDFLKVDDLERLAKADFDVNELMQYTGLKDKNGKEIYEGDILMWNDSRKLEVKWGTVGWVLYGDLFKRFGYPDGDDCNEFNTQGYTNNSEIIGNIYENPELLSNNLLKSDEK